MDRLSDIPTTRSAKTPEEEAVMNNLFPQDDRGSQHPSRGRHPPLDEEASSAEPTSKPKNKMNWKVIAAAFVAFLVLSNPYIDKILCKFPYCEEGSMTLFLTKSIIFFVILLIANYLL